MPLPTNDDSRGLPEAVFSVGIGLANSTANGSTEGEFVSKVAGKASWLRNWRVFVFACLVLISAGVRLVNLGQVPPFLDEDNYSSYAQSVSRLTWKQVVLHPELLAPLTGDKPPLAIVLQAWLNSSVRDLVISGRLLSAGAGIATTILCFLLGRKVGGNGVGLVSMAAYAGSPLAVLHERMVLQDPLMSAFSLAAILAAWTSIQRGSLALAGLSAVLGAIAVQFKVSGLITAVLMLALIVVLDRGCREYWYMAVIGAAGVILSYVVLIVGPGSAGLREQNQTLLGPLSFVWDNLAVLRDTTSTYFPFGLAVLGLVGVVAAVRLKRRAGFMCVLGVFAWATPWVVLSRFAPSRYYLPAEPYACALIALGAVWLVIQAGKLGVRPKSTGQVSGATAACAVALLFAASYVTSVRLATDFLSAPLSPLDDCQYRSCWPSGYPYRAARDFVDAALPMGSSVAYMVDEDHRVALGLERPPPAGIHSLGIVRRDAALPVGSDQPLYVVVDDIREADPGTGLRALLAAYPQFKLTAQFPRPGSTGGVSIVSAP